MKFNHPKGETLLLLPISEELQYQTIKTQTLSRISTLVGDPMFHNRIVWEVFFLYRILKYLVDNLPIPLPAQVLKARDHLIQIFNPDTATTPWKSLLFNQEVSLGLKLDGTAGIVVPTAFLTVKPQASDMAKNIVSATPTLDLDIDYLKNAIQSTSVPQTPRWLSWWMSWMSSCLARNMTPKENRCRGFFSVSEHI